MRKRTKALAFVGESLLWGIANIICMGLPILAVYLLGAYAFEWHIAKTTFYIGLTAALTSTWGSWATLVWTRSRFLRSCQQGVATIPGLLVVGLGATLIYFGIGGAFAGGALITGGVGLVAASVYLAGGLFSKNDVPSKFQYFAGLVVFPLVTTLLSGGVATMWHWFVSEPLYDGIGSFFSIATAMTSLLAAALISTIIPAAASRFCQDALRLGGGGRRFLR